MTEYLARLIKEGQIWQEVTVGIRLNADAFDAAMKQARRDNPVIVRRVIPGLENLDDGAIDGELTK